MERDIPELSAFIDMRAGHPASNRIPSNICKQQGPRSAKRKTSSDGYEHTQRNKEQLPTTIESNSAKTDDRMDDRLDEEKGIDTSIVMPRACQETVQYPVLFSELIPAELFIIPVEVNGIVANAIVDSGAEGCYIHSEFVHHLSQESSKTDHSVRGLAGKILPQGEVKLRVSMHGIVNKEVTFLVVDGEHASRPIVLGVSFLAMNSLVIDVGKRKIEGKVAEGTWSWYVGDEKESCHIIYRNVPVFAQETVKLQHGQSAILAVDSAVTLDGDGYTGCIFCEGKERTELLIDIMLPRQKRNYLAGYCGITYGANVNIMIKNVSGSMKKKGVIKKGDWVGAISTIVNVPQDNGPFHLATEPAEIGSSGAVNVVETARGNDGKLALANDLNEEQIKTVYNVLGKYPDVFSDEWREVGGASFTNFKIELLNETPIRFKPRSFPAPLQEEIDKQVEELLSLNIIENSKSPWSFPIVPVRKKDGSVRLCVDYRKLNAITKADRHPMPNITNEIFRLHGSRYFTSLDLRKGYYQHPLHEGSKEYTAFSTCRGHYQFRVMSFGLKNAPSAFQREMQCILQHFSSQKVLVYVDDILILGESFEEHLDLVERVLKTLEVHKVKLNYEKCSWFQEEVEFLGHVVGRQGVRKRPEYVEQVEKFEKPETVAQLQSFLGLVNFQRKFIKNCSEIAAPLTRLTGAKGKTKLAWTSEMEESFLQLKEELKKDVELSYPDYKPEASKLELYVDASGKGAGAMLCQWQEGAHKVIAYSSMAFSKAQREYSTIERELAAIRWGVGNMRAFLYGVPFVLFTDHKPLIYLNSMSKVKARLTRTLEDLGEFDFEIRYIPGVSNGTADMLSRLGKEPEEGVFSEDDQLPPGLRVKFAPEGGGNSVFECLWYYLGNSYQKKSREKEIPVTCSTDLRILLIDEILRAPCEYGVSKGNNEIAIWKSLKYSTQMPPVDILMSFSKLFLVEVWVHYGPVNPILYNGIPSTCGDTVHLQCLGGVHFNLLCTDGTYTEQARGEQTLQLNEEQELEVEMVDVNSVDQITLLATVVEEYSSRSKGDLDLVEGEQIQLVDNSDPIWWVGQKENGLQGKFKSSHVIVNDTNEMRRLINLEAFSQALVQCQHGLSEKMLVHCRGKLYCGLLDSGAKISLLDEKVFKLLNWDSEVPMSEANGLKVKGIGSGQVPLIGMCTLSVCLVGMRTPVCQVFGIVKEDILPVCFLMGVNYLESAQIVLDFEKGGYSAKGGTHFVTLPQSNQKKEVTGFTVELVHSHKDIAEHQLLAKDNLVALQANDQQLSRLMEVVLEKADPKLWKSELLHRFKRYADKLFVWLGLLYYESPNGIVPVVSGEFTIDFAAIMHYNCSHVGIHKLHDLVSGQVWHPSMAQVVRDVCSSCNYCQLNKAVTQNVAPPVLKIVVNRPMELVSLDLVQLPASRRRSIGCLVCIDHYTKWAAVVPIKDKKAITVVRAFKEKVLPGLIKCPERVLTDNGPEFRASEFQDLMRKYGINHTFTTPNHPSSNGMVERMNQSLIGLLKANSADGADWEDHLVKSVMTYNGTLHTELGMSPAEFILNIEHNENVIPAVGKDIREKWIQGHPKFVPFQVGQKVMRRIPRKGRLNVDKLKPRFYGPCEVTLVHNNGVSYEISDENGVRYRVHHNQLTAWKDPPQYLYQSNVYNQLATVPSLHECNSDSTDYSSTGPLLCFASETSQGLSSEDEDAVTLSESSSSSSQHGFEHINDPSLTKREDGAGKWDSGLPSNMMGRVGSTPKGEGGGLPVEWSPSPVKQGEQCLQEGNYDMEEESIAIVNILEKAIATQSEIIQYIEETQLNDASTRKGMDDQHIGDEAFNSRKDTIEEGNKELPVLDEVHKQITSGRIDFSGFAGDLQGRQPGYLQENNYSGFTTGGPSMTDSTVVSRRESLSPLKRMVQGARRDVEEFRKRQRERLLISKRFRRSPIADTGDLDGDNVASRYATRSKGSVTNLSNVQARPIEYKSWNRGNNILSEGNENI